MQSLSELLNEGKAVLLKHYNQPNQSLTEGLPHTRFINVLYKQDTYYYTYKPNTERNFRVVLNNSTDVNGSNPR